MGERTKITAHEAEIIGHLSKPMTARELAAALGPASNGRSLGPRLQRMASTNLLKQTLGPRGAYVYQRTEVGHRALARHTPQTLLRRRQVRAVLAMLDMSVTTFASRLGVSGTHAQRIIGGTAEPTTLMLESIGEILGPGGWEFATGASDVLNANDFVEVR